MVTTDLDSFIHSNQPMWDRLDQLLRRAGRDPRRLSPAELEELVRLHLRTSSHLSTVRTVHDDPALSAHLSSLVARSSAVVHGSRPRTWATVVRGVTETFPAAVWNARREIAVSAAVFLVAALTVGVWLATSPAAFQAVAPPEVIESYLRHEFEHYYSAEPRSTFAARVFTNNAQVGALAFGAGALLAIPTLLILAFNGVNVGVAAGLFHAAGEPARFWGLILPHGLLELTAVFVAGGAGLRLGWSVIAPGDRSRRASFAEEGRRSVVIVLGLVLVFLVAGLIEGFVTPAPWPTWARVGTGAIVWLVFCVWIVVAGRQAAARGLTGAFREERRAPVAAPRRSPPRVPTSRQSPPRALTSR